MKNKNKLNKLKKNYFKLPNKILEIGLTPTALALYVYLAKQAEDFNPSVITIARSLKVSKGTVVSYFKELKNRNIVKCIEPGGERKITKYEFCPVEDWK